MSDYQSLSGYQLLLSRANQKKANPTVAEKILLSALETKLPIYQFRFQIVMVPFIVDFVSLAKKVILEVDGSSHEHTQDADSTRQYDLERDGYSFLRFTNYEVLHSIDKVIVTIKDHCALPYSHRRKHSAAKAEYVQRGTLPYVVGEGYTFADYYTRREESMLLAYDPFEDEDEVVKVEENSEIKPVSSIISKNFPICVLCKMLIELNQARFRYRESKSESISWVHSKCRIRGI